MEKVLTHHPGAQRRGLWKAGWCTEKSTRNLCSPVEPGSSQALNLLAVKPQASDLIFLSLCLFTSKNNNNKKNLQYSGLWMD